MMGRLRLADALTDFGSIRIGNWLGYHADISTFYALYEHSASLEEWASWLLSDAAPALVIGLFFISTIAAAIGYVVSAVGWTIWVRRKRRLAGAGGAA